MPQRWNQPAARLLVGLTLSVFISISPAVFGQPSMPAAFSGTTPGSSGTAEQIVGSVDEILTVERIEVGSAASSEGERTRQEVLTFSRGSVVERLRSFGGDQFRSRSRFSYDDQGRLVRWRGLDREGNILWEYRYEYDDRGNLTQETSTAGDGELLETTVYQYVGHQIVAEVLYVDSRVEWRKTYRHDAAGNRSEWSLTDGEGIRFKHVEEFRDETGRTEREVHYDQFGAVLEEVFHAYDEIGRLVAVTTRDGTGSVLSRREYRYRGDGRILRDQTTIYEEDGTTTETVQYTYDEVGNWIHRETTLEVGPEGDRTVVRRKIAERTITYREESLPR